MSTATSNVAGPNHMTTNAGLVDPHFLDMNVNVFEPHRPLSIGMDYHEHKEYRPTTKRFGEACTIRVSQDAHIYGHLQLHLQVPLLNFALMGGATFVQWRDLPGLTCLEYVEIKYGTDKIQRLTRDIIYTYFAARKSAREFDAWLYLIGSTDDKAAQAAAAQEWIVELPFYFTIATSHNIKRFHLANDIEIIIKFQPLNKVVSTNATNNNTSGLLTNDSFTDVWIKWYVHTVPNRVKDSLASQIQMYDEGKMIKGITAKAYDWEYHENILVASGTQTARIELTNIKNPCAYLTVIARRSADYTLTDTLAGGAPFNSVAGGFIEASPWNFQRIDQMWLEKNNVRFTPVLYHNELIYQTNVEKFNSPTGLLLYHINFSKTPLDEMNNWGHQNFGTMRKVELVLYWSSAISSNYYITIIGAKHQKWHEIRGQWYPMLDV